MLLLVRFYTKYMFPQLVIMHAWLNFLGGMVVDDVALLSTNLKTEGMLKYMYNNNNKSWLLLHRNSTTTLFFTLDSFKSKKTMTKVWRKLSRKYPVEERLLFRNFMKWKIGKSSAFCKIVGKPPTIHSSLHTSSS